MGNEFEKYFVEETLIDFEIDGMTFKYKPITADDELDWTPEYIEEVASEGGIMRVPNLKKLTKCQLRSIKEVPFPKEIVKKFTGIDKEFKDLNDQEKDIFWGKTDPGFLDKVIRKVKELRNSNEELKKN